ncbi:MAG: Ribosome maturation factor RimM [Haliscomenobacter sp.]|jgi:16S rRNA processing protein RimM|nr:Ribosome maturation factor RimM [Haliscomenobacter sp.]
MQDTEFIAIGKTGRTHGTSGALKILIDDRYLEDFVQSDLVFLEIKGKRIPYFIEEILETNALLVKLEEIDSPEDAHALCGKTAYLRKADLLPENARESSSLEQYERFVGFMIKDVRLGPLGQIESILELPQQFLAAITYQGKERLIPMHPQLILGVDQDLKEIQMELPEGILDM